MNRFDLVIFLNIDATQRLKRLSGREAQRYGTAALEPGGSRHSQYKAFMTWAAGYDDPGFTGRNRTGHETWLAYLECPVLRLDSAAPVEDLVSGILAADINDL